MSLLELYCAVDDFCQAMEHEQEGRLLSEGNKGRQRTGQLSDSEALTIMSTFIKASIEHSKRITKSM